MSVVGVGVHFLPGLVMAISKNCELCNLARESTLPWESRHGICNWG